MDVINLSRPTQFVSKTVTAQANEWSGGEIDFRILDFNPSVEEATIFARLNNSDDIMRLFMAAGVYNKVHVVFPYLPYARQDRACNLGEPFSLRVFASLLNSQKFGSVKVFDPHSNVAELLIDNFIGVNNHKFLKDVMYSMRVMHNVMPKDVCLVSPDAGALKKINDLAVALGNLKVLPCLKKRNLDGGAIEQVYVSEDKLDPNLTYVIVDDICDGGRTFIALAKALKSKGAEKIHLVVSHGIFSNGIGPLLSDSVDYIWTTNSIDPYVQDSADFKVFDVMGYLK